MIDLLAADQPLDRTTSGRRGNRPPLRVASDWAIQNQIEADQERRLGVHDSWADWGLEDN